MSTLKSRLRNASSNAHGLTLTHDDVNAILDVIDALDEHADDYDHEVRAAVYALDDASADDYERRVRHGEHATDADGDA